MKGTLIMSKNNYYNSPGYFSKIVSSDLLRKEYDIKNSILIENNLHPDFIFIGDTVINNWELNAYFKSDHHLIINRGIKGDTTTYLLKRLFADVLQHQPTYCILHIGFNDSNLLEDDYWNQITGANYDEILANSKKNYQNILEQFSTSQTIPIVTSLLPIKLPISCCESKRKQYINELNQFLADYCKEHHIIYVDYYHTTVIPGSNMVLKGITFDGVHPNVKGYNMMAMVLKNTLKKYNITI